MAPDQPKTLNFNYKFTLPNKTVREIDVKLDARTLSMIPTSKPQPDWTRLSFSQCPNCPLKEATSPRCPIAANLVDLIGLFHSDISYDRVLVEVTTPERTYSKETTMAEGISSLIGLFMATSGCPILDKLKPMARTHLPFSSWEETLYRTMSAYLMAQHFIAQEGKPADWPMRDLQKIADDINQVNAAFCTRLRSTHMQDAALNAVVQLDCFANLTATFLGRDRLKELRPLFEAYLN